MKIFNWFLLLAELLCFTALGLALGWGVAEFQHYTHPGDADMAASRFAMNVWMAGREVSLRGS